MVISVIVFQETDLDERGMQVPSRLWDLFSMKVDSLVDLYKKSVATPEADRISMSHNNTEKSPGDSQGVCNSITTGKAGWKKNDPLGIIWET